MIIDLDRLQKFLKQTMESMYSLSAKTGIDRNTMNKLGSNPEKVINSNATTLIKLQEYVNMEDKEMKTTQDLTDLGYDRIYDFGDYDLYVRFNKDTHNQFFEAYIKYHENVVRKDHEFLLEKNAYTEIKSITEEIDADDNFREDLHQYADELLGV